MKAKSNEADEWQPQWLAKLSPAVADERRKTLIAILGRMGSVGVVAEELDSTQIQLTHGILDISKTASTNPTTLLKVSISIVLARFESFVLCCCAGCILQASRAAAGF